MILFANGNVEMCEEGNATIAAWGKRHKAKPPSATLLHHSFRNVNSIVVLLVTTARQTSPLGRQHLPSIPRIARDSGGPHSRSREPARARPSGSSGHSRRSSPLGLPSSRASALPGSERQSSHITEYATNSFVYCKVLKLRR